MTSIERTAYLRFKRLITARELHVFFTPGEEERVWAEEVADPDEHQLALLVALTVSGRTSTASPGPLTPPWTASSRSSAWRRHFPTEVFSVGSVG
ncbi:hypothetical protein [Streptomyces sp. NPDC086766]|uniref:hypothetical protein n=1 Tax=Streptomyces sp. NPDC086766 TaxID=3365754 RepID=UPI0038031488